MTWLGVLDKEERGNDNGTSLKEGDLVEMSTTVLPLRDARSLRFEYLPFWNIDHQIHLCNTLRRKRCTKH